MSLFSDNIKHLRIKKEIPQREVAENLGITRERYAKYEDGASEPPFEILRKISIFFHVSIDLLLSVNVLKIPLDELMKLDDNRILLPIKVDRNEQNLIEIIPHTAKAGYALGYADPEFIENLQQISLPFLRTGKFRAFPVEGDSMPPHKEGSYIVGKYVENLGQVRDGKTYILLTRNEGIVYKRLNKNGKNSLMLHSDNTLYNPYEVKASEVLEVWEYACSIATTEFEPLDPGTENVMDVLKGLRKEIREMRGK
jgi:transcriptional regulator with XRE-family HTH domain